jgi:hypothetical protein
MSRYDNFNEILRLLEQCPGFPSAIGMEKAMVFVQLATRLKGEIVSKQKPGVILQNCVLSMDRIFWFT